MQTPPTGDRTTHPGTRGALSTTASTTAQPRRRSGKRIVLPLLALLALLAACDAAGEDGTGEDGDGGGSAEDAPTDGAADDIEPAFIEDPDCFDVDAEGAGDLTCGTVEVPLDHDAPDAGTIELAVVVDAAADTAGAGAPLLVLGGGPGEVLVEPYLTTPELREVFAAERTTIVIDQRGVGSSDPALECQELASLEVQETAAEDLDAALESLGECRDRLADDGVDLDAYHHLANARDIDLVRRALGHDQLNLRGTSYGTQVALLAAERFPDTVRSVVLSSPVDPRANWVEGVPAGFARSLDRLAAACAEVDACTDQVGDLRDAIEETVQRLEEQPEEVTVEPPGGGTSAVEYTPSRFVAGLFNLFYQAELTALLPAIVDRAQDGDLAPLATIIATLEEQLEDGVSVGMQQSMLCTGEAALADPERALAGVDDELVTEHWYPTTTLGESVDEVCDRWDVEQVYDPAEITLETEVPTLIVTGGLDHVTPPELGERLHETLPVSHLVEVEWAVHAPLEALSLTGPCGQRIVTDFLDDPDDGPDAGCADDFTLRLGTPLPAGLG